MWDLCVLSCFKLVKQTTLPASGQRMKTEQLAVSRCAGYRGASLPVLCVRYY